ncbi:MAG: CHAT domain-containing protein [Bacteroidia bacterium]|nr:CHAT domain-containing protein [Bacteroidia bacterium]
MRFLLGLLGFAAAQHLLLHMADSLLTSGKYEAALRLYDSIETTFATSDSLLLRAYIGGAECLANLQEYEKAHKWITAGESLAIRLRDTVSWTKLLYYRAWIWGDIGDYQRAESLYKVTLEWQRHYLGENHPDYALTLNDMGLLEQILGRYSTAESLLSRASAIQRKVIGETHPHHLITLHNLAIVFTGQGHFSKAESLMHWIAKTEEQVLGKEHPTYLNTLQQIAILHDYQGRYAESEALLRQIAPLQAQIMGEENISYLNTLNYLASNYTNQGRYGEAEALLRKVCGTLVELLGEHHPSYLGRLNNLAVVYERQGRYVEAEMLYHDIAKRQLETFGEEHPAYLTTIHNWAFVLDIQNKYQQAESLYKYVAGLRARVLGENHPDRLIVLHNLALLLEKQQRYTEAESLCRQIGNLQLHMLGETHPDYLATMSLLASTLKKQGRYQEAESLYQNTLRTQAQALPEHHPLYTSTLHGIINLYEKTGNYTQSDSLWRVVFDRTFRYIRQEFISLPSYIQERFLVTKLSARYSDLQKYVAKRGAQSPSLIQLGYRVARSMKGLILTSSEGLKHLAEASADTSVRMLVKDWRRWMSMHAVAAMEGRQKEADSLWRLILAAEQDLMKLLPEVRSFLPDPFSEPDPPLKEDEAIIEVVRVQEEETVRYNFYLLTRHKKKHALQLYTHTVSPAWEAQAQTIFEILRSPGTQLNSMAYSTLWSFIDSLIPKNVKRLYFSPDGIYYRINIGALYDGKKFIADRYDVRYTASSRRLILKRLRTKPQNKPIVIGNPAFDRVPAPISGGKVRSHRLLGMAITPLPGAEQEAREIAQLLNIRPVIGDSATEEFVKSLLGPQILHIATHGYFQEGTGSAMLRSGMLFAGAAVWDSLYPPPGSDDGYLTAREAASMNLIGTEVVVLSACETGLGDITGEGLYGLQRAFLEAGAQRVVATLWQIDDAATQELMKLFYQEWVAITKPISSKRRRRQRESPSNELEDSLVDMAFKKASDRFRNSYPEPYYWGAFIVVR